MIFGKKMKQKKFPLKPQTYKEIYTRKIVKNREDKLRVSLKVKPLINKVNTVTFDKF